MTENITNPYADDGKDQSAPKPWWKKTWVHLIAVGVVGLGLGAAIGPAPETVEVATPAVTVTPDTIYVEDTVVQYSVSEECLALADDAEDYIGYSADLMGHVSTLAFLASDAVSYASVWDAEGLDAVNADMDDLADDLAWTSDLLTSSTLADNIIACRASAEN